MAETLIVLLSGDRDKNATKQQVLMSSPMALHVRHYYILENMKT